MVLNTIMSTTTENQTSDSKAAPGQLALVQDFINTLDVVPRAEERLSDPSALARWLAQRQLLSRGQRLTPADVRHAVEVREALRDLLVMNSGQRPRPEAIQTLSRAARGSQVMVGFDAAGEATLAPLSGGLDAAIGKLIAIVAESMLEGTWSRLKPCADATCRWAFYDSSKNRSGSWCSMASCGNRCKARRYRTRATHGARRS